MPTVKRLSLGLGTVLFFFCFSVIKWCSLCSIYILCLRNRPCLHCFFSHCLFNVRFFILFFISIWDHLKWKWCKFHKVLKCVIASGYRERATLGYWIIGNSVKCVHLCGFIRIKYLWNKTLNVLALHFVFSV